MRKAAAESAKQELIRLCHGGLDSQTLRLELLKRLQNFIPFDYVYFSTTDPATQLSTSAVLTQAPPAWLMSVFLDNEFLQSDYNKFSVMLRERRPVGTLSEATQHEPERSRRYRDMLVPLAMADELRAIFTSDNTCWGTLCLHREDSETGYTPDDSEFVAQLAPHIAHGLRKALLLGDISTSASPGEPGVLILNDDLSRVAATAAAEYWLTELVEIERGDPYSLPLPVRSVVARLKAIECGIAEASLPKARLLMRSGQWLLMHASRLNSSAGLAQISVIFEIAQPAEIAPLMMQAYQLTKREGEITQCVLLGWSTNDIAARLYISANTVQDHLKAIFEKVDVSSRGELAARIFKQHYQSSFTSDAPLNANGQFRMK